MRAMAAEKLPVLQLSGLTQQELGPVLRTLEASGYAPEVVPEAAFVSGGATGGNLLVPLEQGMSEAVLSSLSRYLERGGKLVLIAPDDTPDMPMSRLLQGLGMEVTGSTFAARQMNLRWKGQAQTSDESLPAGTSILAIAPNARLEVRATWGNDYPAIINTKQATLLNWHWGRELSLDANRAALAKAVPVSANAETVASAVPTPMSPAPANPRPANGNGMQPSQPTASPVPMLSAQDANRLRERQAAASAVVPTPEPAASQKNDPAKAQAAKPEPKSRRELKAERKAEEDRIKAERAAAEQAEEDRKRAEKQARDLQEIQEKAARKAARDTEKAREKAAETQKEARERDKKVADEKPAPSQSTPVKTATPVPSQPATAQTPTPGLPNPSRINTTTRPGEKTGGDLKEELEEAATGGPKQDAGTVAPEFDYGVYSYNMRQLDDYRVRIADALETSRQLALDIPAKRIEQLLQEANQHRKQFEALYLNGNTITGLEEYEQARRLTLQALALTAASPRVEGRAIWLDRGTIVEAGNPEKLRQLMNRMHQAGINIVYFETLNAGFPIYPSKILRHNPLVNDWDPLQVAVAEGHRLGMEVHAWVWAFAVGNRRHNAVIGMPDSYPGPILTEHGLQSEALLNASGGYLPDSKQTEYWVSPASTKGRQFLIDIYKEIVSNYDVDGLQLDYIRYPFQSSQTPMGFEAIGRDRFYRATGQSLDGLDDYKRKLWIAWKTYQVSSFVQQVSENLKRIKPTLRLSAAVFPMQRNSRIVAIQQDWETWIDNGWIDTLSPMSYTRDPEKLRQLYNYVANSPQKHTIVYPGIALSSIDPGTLTLEVETVRNQGGFGSTLFAGAHLDDEKVEILGTGPYKDKSTQPPHRDPISSMRTILGDYQEKLTRLRSNGQLAGLETQVQAIDYEIQKLSATLKAMGDNGATITPKLGEAQQNLATLKSATNNWLNQDRLIHRFRAQYFENSMMMLENLLGYVVDRFMINSSVAYKTNPQQIEPGVTPVALQQDATGNAPSVTHANGIAPTTGN